MRLKVPTPEHLAHLARGLRDPMVAVRAMLLEERFKQRRDLYARQAEARRLRYDESSLRAGLAQRLASRGVKVSRRARGEVRTLAFFAAAGWHRQLIPHLEALGPLHLFDYHQHGVTNLEIYGRTTDAVARRQRMNARFVDEARALGHGAVDWVFLYANALEIDAATIESVREATGAPVVCMCLDDKQSWDEQRDIVAATDLGWTSARVTCEWYLVEGGFPLFLPEGCSPEVFSPAAGEPDLPIVFVGQAYGFRKEFVARLRAAGLEVVTRGPGWPEGPVSEAEIIGLFRRARIILGHGGVGWSQSLRNLKGRDFDAPCVGGGVYLTTFNPDLVPYFAVREEVEMFAGELDAVEVARQLLSDDERRRRIAAAGRQRCLRDHSWQRRFEAVLETLGVRFDDEAAVPAASTC